MLLRGTGGPGPRNAIKSAGANKYVAASIGLLGQVARLEHQQILFWPGKLLERLIITGTPTPCTWDVMDNFNNRILLGTNVAYDTAGPVKYPALTRCSLTESPNVQTSTRPHVPFIIKAATFSVRIQWQCTHKGQLDALQSSIVTQHNLLTYVPTSQGLPNGRSFSSVM